MTTPRYAVSISSSGPRAYLFTSHAKVGDKIRDDDFLFEVLAIFPDYVHEDGCYTVLVLEDNSTGELIGEELCIDFIDISENNTVIV